jgi:eukaryotic translation initiation factor 2C
MECCITEVKSKKKLTEKETADMIKHTAVRAPDRMKYIDNWVNKSGIKADPILKEYNIDVNLKMVELEGRVMEAPDIQYRTNQMSSRQIGDKGSWDHRNFNFNVPRKVENWVVINASSRVRDDAMNEFIKMLMRIGKIHGIEMRDAVFVQNYAPRRGSSEQQILNDMKNMFEMLTTKYKPLDLVVAIFGGTTPVYKVVKTCGDILFGVPTQGVEDKNVNRLSDQTISNILLKINTKLGGRNFILSQSNKL